MNLPVEPPLAPMLAKGVDKIPEGEGWIHEPKWDGFRAVIFRDGDELQIQSRSKKPLLRYFPELRAPLLKALPERCVVDGELVIEREGSLHFGSLQMRLHPAASRIETLADEIPAKVILWDLLAVGDDSLLDTPFEARRRRLEREVQFGEILLTPATLDHAVAADWFARFEGAGLDGVVSKLAQGVYEPGKRAMRKTKRKRTVDCVLTGFRWHKSGAVVGSLILGLYDQDGKLQQLGVASSFTAKRRLELVTELEPLREGALEAHPWRGWSEADGERRAGMKSRWHGGRDLSWEPVRLERVVEVECNQLSENRLRHPARFVRWRLDREPASCSFEQVLETPAPEIAALIGLTTNPG